MSYPLLTILYTCILLGLYFSSAISINLDCPRYNFIVAALLYILTQKKQILRCDSIAPYSEFLGLHITSGAYRKTQELGNLVSDPLLLHYFLNVPSGHQKLGEHLRLQDMVLAKDGQITINQTTSKKNDR